MAKVIVARFVAKVRVATSYRVPTSNGTSYRTKSSYECKIHSYDGRNGHKLSYEFGTMPSYCVVRSYDNLWRFRHTLTLILRSYDSLCRACGDPKDPSYKTSKSEKYNKKV